MIISIIFSILITGVRPNSEISPPATCDDIVLANAGFGLTDQDLAKDFCERTECRNAYGENADNFLCLKDDSDNYCMPSWIEKGLLDESWYTRNFTDYANSVTLETLYDKFAHANWEGADLNKTATSYSQIKAQAIKDLYYINATFEKIADLCSPCGKKLMNVAYNVSKIFNKDYDICLVPKDGKLGDCFKNINDAMALGGSVTEEDMKDVMSLIPKFLNNPVLCHPCFYQYVQDGILETPALKSLPVNKALYNGMVCPAAPTQAPTMPPTNKTNGGSTLYLGTSFLVIPVLVELFLV